MTLSLALQRIPVFILRISFRIEDTVQKAYSLSDHRILKCPRKLRCRVPRSYAVFPWFLLYVFVIGSFFVTGLLTSKGLLGTNEFDETGTPCRCRGIAGGADVEADWLILVCMVFVFKWLIYQPVALFLATCLHLREANKTAATMLKRQAGINVEMQHRGDGGGDTGETKDDGNHPSTHVENPMRVVASRKSTASYHASSCGSVSSMSSGDDRPHPVRPWSTGDDGGRVDALSAAERASLASSASSRRPATRKKVGSTGKGLAEDSVGTSHCSGGTSALPSRVETLRSGPPQTDLQRIRHHASYDVDAPGSGGEDDGGGGDGGGGGDETKSAGIKSSVERKGTRFGGNSAVKKSFDQESVQVIDAVVGIGPEDVKVDEDFAVDIARSGPPRNHPASIDELTGKLD